MAEICNVNGQLESAENVGGYSNRAFKYGDGVFESIRLVNGAPVFLHKHFQRLSHGLKQLKIINTFTFHTFSNEVMKTIRANNIQEGGRLRFTAYRDADGFYTPSSNQIDFFIEVEAVEENLFTINPQGLRIDLCENIKIEINQFSNIKTLNALPYVMAGIYKKEQQLDEVLLLNSNGNICEGSSSNVFLYADNVLLTPPLSHGCINGIMRSEIMEIAKSQKIKVIENTVGLKEMEIAEEVFFTNAIQGIKWVSAFRKKRYFNSQSKAFLNLLNSKFE